MTRRIPAAGRSHDRCRRVCAGVGNAGPGCVAGGPMNREIGEPDGHSVFCHCVVCEEEFAPPIEDEEDD